MAADSLRMLTDALMLYLLLSSQNGFVAELTNNSKYGIDSEVISHF